MIAIRNLFKKRGQQIVLHNISLDVAPGEILAIIGPSGSGKTTLLRCINALETFDSGSITVGEVQYRPGTRNGVTRHMLLQLRRSVGMVFQQYHLFPHKTILANVMCGPIYVLGWKSTTATAEARALLERVGLGSKAECKPHELSGGEQQRVAIARCLAVHPAAILFDEPMSALDSGSSEQVMEIIRDLARVGKSIVVVTHDLRCARAIAQSVCVLSGGEIVEKGLVSHIFSAPAHPTTQRLLQQMPS